MQFTVYYDYLCPYVYRGTEWVYTLQEHLDEPLEVTWRYFSLAQVNYRARDGWKIWDEPGQGDAWQEADFARGLRMFWAAEAARRQGDDAFRKMHQAILRAVHAEKVEIANNTVLIDLADKTGLDRTQFATDMSDPTCVERLGVDHTAGAELSVFGTPTFVIGNAKPAYLKLSQIPEPAEAIDFWHKFQNIVAEKPYVIEIKRPQ